MRGRGQPGPVLPAPAPAGNAARERRAPRSPAGLKKNMRPPARPKGLPPPHLPAPLSPPPSQDCQTTRRRLILVAGPHPHAIANSAVLVGLYGVIARGLSGPAAYAPLAPLEPFTPFRDASTGPSTYHLRVPDVLAGFARARATGLIDDWTSPSSVFDVAEYDHYEAVENGDLNWIVPGRFLAFSGPYPTPRMT